MKTKNKVDIKVVRKDFDIYKNEIYLNYYNKRDKLIKLVDFKDNFKDFTHQSYLKNGKIKKYRRKITPQKYKLEFVEIKI